MGTGRWDPHAYTASATARSTMRTEEIFTATNLKKTLDPKGVLVRESRDSADNPQSTAIIIGVDVTGSMGMLAEVMARKSLGTLFTEILTRLPVTDPHLMFMAIGDANYDRAPLQVSQFEADIRINDQLADIYIEHGGGGNHFESYNLPWYFAANHTSIDCMEKRGRKGYLFTIGDEEAPQALTREQIVKFIGDTPETDQNNDDLLAAVQRMYHVFHVVVMEGNHARAFPNAVRDTWTKVLGQRVLFLSDYHKLSEVIVSAIQITEGALPADVIKSWSDDTSLVVAEATRSLTYDAGAGAVVTL